MSGLSVREKAAQLIMAPFYGEAPNTRSKAYREYVALVRDLQVGGLILLNRVQGGAAVKAEPYATGVFLNRMQRLAGIPLLVGADFERGASMRVSGTPQFPHAMAFGAADDLESTRALGRATARECRALGVHWLFAPSADVNSNPDNPVIGIRSFSSDPNVVARHVEAFLQGARQDPAFQVLTTVKHFPGHGDTTIDSHVGLGVIDADRARLLRVELVPFQAAIRAGVDAVMTAHISVPALETAPIPATISAAINTELLRGELGFHGLLSTDALDKQALSRSLPPGEAAVRALLAGADLLLAPPNPREAVRAIAAAVQSGRIPMARLNRSVEKLLAAKVRLGLHRQRLVNLEAMEELLDLEEDRALAQSVAERAVTLVKNEGSVLPLRDPDSACWLVLSGSRFSGTGRRLLEELRSRAPAARTHHLDPQAPIEQLNAIADSLPGCASVVTVMFTMAGVSSNGEAVPGNYTALLARLRDISRPWVMVAMGNPYLVNHFPEVTAYVAAFSTVEPSEIAVLRALLGEIPMPGRLPITLNRRERASAAGARQPGLPAAASRTTP